MALEIADSSEANINAHPICIQALETAEVHPVIELPPDLKNPDFSLSEQTNYMPWKRIIAIFLACASVDMVALIDQTTLAVSLPVIASALHASAQASWIANGYFVTSTSFQLLYGRLSDIWSRKIVLLSGLLIFFLGSLAASVAGNSMQLIIFRAFTGIGGGGLMTVAQIIVSDVVTLRERGKYQGILGAVVAMSNGVGPVIGGALASQSENSCSLVAIQAGVKRQDMAVVTGTRNFVRNLGAAMGLAVAGTISTNSLRTSLLPLNLSEGRLKEILNQPTSFYTWSAGSVAEMQLRAAILAGYHRGFRIIFILGASLSAFACLVALLMMPELGLDRKDDEELKREAKTEQEKKQKTEV
ncbi:hypothetical protein MMC29_000225 [Sticta canariensis]|nr:hypothetical protein [Sticta canariensis]